MKTRTKRFYTLLIIICLPIVGSAQYNYSEVLQKSQFFYEAQRSGELPPDNRVSWRGNSGMTDGNDVGIDLRGGWYDAGDHIKFGFPMAFTATALNWGYLEYTNGYIQSGQVDQFKKNMRWVTDYFIKCHTAPNEFYGQVSAKNPDHSFWIAAELVDDAYTRLSYKIDAANPGTDLACETAAALASASIVFADSDPVYSATLLQHAEELYNFGDQFRGEYTGSIPAENTYPSTGYFDELVWGALWLYKATNDVTYLNKAIAEYDNMAPDFLWSLVWDDKSYGSMVMLAVITGEDKYKIDAEKHLDFWMNGGGVTYSPGGLAWLFQWGSLRHTANAALTAFIYSDNVNTTKKTLYHDFAVRQMNYILGDNPSNRSYVIGFGNNPPKNPHHRTVHGPWENRDGGLPVQSRHTLYGALVGGPNADDSYADDRTDFRLNEVACDYNACFQGAIARMVEEFGGTPLANFPLEETPVDEFIIETKVNAPGTAFTEKAIWVYNRSAWPARVLNDFQFRYFVDLSEGFAAGYNLTDYTVSRNFSEGGTVSSLQPWDVASDIYYVEVSFQNAGLKPTGISPHRRETQIRIALPNDAPAGAWDPTNDPSFVAGNSLTRNENIALYSGGQLIYGNEPNGSGRPNAVVEADSTSGFAPFTVFFDGSTSSDPDGQALSYLWDFGDGTSSIISSPSHTYTSTGSFIASLTVTDTDGLSDTETVTITVVDSAPTAIISTSAQSGIAPLTITFDGSSSSDPNGGPLLYSWDFGDGTSSNLTVVDHTYDAVGSYLVTLLVTDEEGKSDSASTVINVLEKINTQPVAVIIANPISGLAPLLVTFDASGSSDADGDTLTYSYDFGDGTIGTGVTTSHTYSSSGVYTATLIVDDGNGGTDSESINITVTVDGECNLLSTYGVPLNTGLPSTGYQRYQNIYPLGSGGPNLDNVTEITVNWENASTHNGLYQFSIQTNNGQPSWWQDLRASATYDFLSPEPQVTFTGSGFTGLDGTYYVNRDGDNFVMVEISGAYGIYLSQTPVVPQCISTSARKISVIEDPSENFVVYPNPSSQSFNLSVQGNSQLSQISVYDNLGRRQIVLGEKAIISGTINFGNELDPGFYTIRLVSNSTTQTINIIKK